jgi:hypothetical protein
MSVSDGPLYCHKPLAFIYLYARSHANRWTCAYVAHVISSRASCSDICVLWFDEVNFLQKMESDPEITRDNNNHYNYINNILYSTIKYSAWKHISPVSFLWVYSKSEIKEYDFFYIFRKKLTRKVVKMVHKVTWFLLNSIKKKCKWHQ